MCTRAHSVWTSCSLNWRRHRHARNVHEMCITLKGLPMVRSYAIINTHSLCEAALLQCSEEMRIKSKESKERKKLEMYRRNEELEALGLKQFEYFFCFNTRSVQEQFWQFILWTKCTNNKNRQTCVDGVRCCTSLTTRKLQIFDTCEGYLIQTHAPHVGSHLTQILKAAPVEILVLELDW